MNNFIEDVKYIIPDYNKLIHDRDINILSQNKIVGLLDKKEEIYNKLVDININCNEYLNTINDDYFIILSDFNDLEYNIDELND